MSKNNDWSAIIWHAGLTPDEECPSTSNLPPFVEAIWKKKRGEQVALKASAEDFISELQKANKIVNGSVPSETFARNSGIPGELAYAVSNVITQCIELAASEKFSENPKQFSALAWMLSCAWDGLLAGDIDDIVEHVRVEANARGISLS